MGKRVAVLGGSSGIGLAVASALVAEGARVAIASARQDSLDRARASIASPHASFALVDVRDEAQIARYFDNDGAFDHVVYTAGEALQLGALADTATSDVRRAFDVRYFGALAVAKFAAPRINPGGSLVFTTGVAAVRPGAGWSAGASVTSAVEGLTRALAVELAPLRVNAVSPGVVRTPLWDPLDTATRDGLYAEQAASLLVGRVGEAADIATAYLYLMENAYATGTVVVADGGYVLV